RLRRLHRRRDIAAPVQSLYLNPAHTAIAIVHCGIGEKRSNDPYHRDGNDRDAEEDVNHEGAPAAFDGVVGRSEADREERTPEDLACRLNATITRVPEFQPDAPRFDRTPLLYPNAR